MNVGNEITVVLLYPYHAKATVRPEPGQSRLQEPGSNRRQAAASLAKLASSEAAGHL